jgi:hypothetical protein
MSVGIASLAGRLILSAISLFTAVSPYLADWNATHIYNPLWPPHAKYHNAQTMAFGALLGIAGLVFAWRRGQAARTNLQVAALLASLYWVSQAMAFAFPGVGWTDPNLLPPGKTLDSLPIQVPLLLAVLAMIGAGFGLAMCGLAADRGTRS